VNDNGTRESGGKSDTVGKVRYWLIKGYMGGVMMAAMLFLPAWRLDWWMGWVLVAIWMLWHTSLAITLMPTNPELLAERVVQKKGIKTWDTALMSIVGILVMAQYILAGLDVRNGWTLSPDGTNPIPLAVQIVAAAIVAAGYALGTWSMVSNAFFSKIVRIQADRGHTVATGGPYRYVRHPGYLGQVLVNLGLPVMLGSLWTLIPSVVIAVLFFVRTALEDRTLQEELPGYEAYAQHTRYRCCRGSGSCRLESSSRRA
jgi:protein-S-isoprenylcysteine O-methyltransferase Ste14